ncbi:MAG: hypothetical protein OXF86_12010 [Caldilineaceae bacterium]|nr:hypothetical protein [Caldilineaceae bacterium]
MTVDKSRFAAELELPPEAEEMMAKITELTGCIVVNPEESTRRLKEACERVGTTSPRVFAYIMDGVLAANEIGVAGIFIQLRPLEEPGPAEEPASEQFNGKIYSWKEIPQYEFRQFRPFWQLMPSEMSQLGTLLTTTEWESATG